MPARQQRQMQRQGGGKAGQATMLAQERGLKIHRPSIEKVLFAIARIREVLRDGTSGGVWRTFDSRQRKSKGGALTSAL